MPRQQRQRNLLRAAAAWWDSDANRLLVIRTIAYGLFAASVAGTIYAAVKGVLPIWAVTVYVAFAVQLTFMTFMYAIRHSGAEEIRRSIYDLRRRNLPEWQFERELLAEFARYAFCTAHGVDPSPPRPPGPPGRRARQARTPWPQIDTSTVACSLVREHLTSKLDRQPDASRPGNRPTDDELTLSIDFIAYSAETLINLSRAICDEIAEVQDERARFEGSIRARVLIRDNRDEVDWLVPLATDQLSDTSYGRDLRTRFRNVQRSALREFQESLKDLTSPRQVDFRLRGYHVEPLLKGVMVDRTQGLFGLYTVSDLKDPEGWDYSGHAVTLCPCDVNGDYVSALAAGMFNRWFDQLWENEQLTRSIAT
jgi:hypothetical protein